jgi:hypothetical protein
MSTSTNRDINRRPNAQHVADELLVVTEQRPVDIGLIYAGYLQIASADLLIHGSHNAPDLDARVSTIDSISTLFPAKSSLYYRSAE